MDYNEFSERIKTKYPQYKDIDNRELAQKFVDKYPTYANQVSFDEPLKGGIQETIDLTPSGILERSTRNVANAITTPILSFVQKKKPSDVWQETDKILREQDKIHSNTKLGKATKIATDLVGYGSFRPFQIFSGLPFVNNLANGLLQGALIGGLEGLKNGENPLASAGQGGLIGGTLNAALPPLVRGVGKLTNKLAANAFPGLSEETVRQVIKPNSKALDLNKKTVQSTLTDLTERIRNNYNNILADKGNKVGQLLGKLPENAIINKENVLADMDKVYNNYSLSKNPNLNPARNATLKEQGKIEDLLNNSMFEENLAPQELYDINKNISNMVDWNKADSALKNDVLEKIYGANAERISNLSPELREANKVYSDLMDFQKNEGIRRILNNSNNIDTASSALRNYNSTITSGNKGRNIADLEKILVDNGYSPFINDIDDINAANEIIESVKTGFNPGGLVDKAKNILEIPTLKVVREINRLGIPQNIENINNALLPYAQRLLAPAIIEASQQ
ncbi:MAG: hypothetical protein MJ180_00185 [Candidatus Gastranaerophilales bacterium]|nr:hypothetical protein [Candidatus Gastranaerophilales bacterium]